MIKITKKIFDRIFYVFFNFLLFDNKKNISRHSKQIKIVFGIVTTITFQNSFYLEIHKNIFFFILFMYYLIYLSFYCLYPLIP